MLSNAEIDRLEEQLHRYTLRKRYREQQRQIGILAAALRWRCPWMSKRRARFLVEMQDWCVMELLSEPSRKRILKTRRRNKL